MQSADVATTNVTPTENNSAVDSGDNLENDSEEEIVAEPIVPMDVSVPTMSTYVAIDGPPGSGKNDVLEILSQIFLGSTFVYAEGKDALSEDCEIFKKSSKNPKRWMFTRQVHVTNIMRATHWSALLNPQNLTIGVYGINSVWMYNDFWFEKDTLQDLEYDVLKENPDTNTPLIYETIFLEPVNPESCLERLICRKNQFPYSKDDIIRIVNGYKKNLYSYMNVPVDESDHLMLVAYRVYELIMNILKKQIPSDDYEAVHTATFDKYVKLCILQNLDNEEWFKIIRNVPVSVV